MSSLFQIDGPIGRNLARMMDIFLLNVTFILFSLPIVTIGASLTALYTVSFKKINGEDPSVWRSYIKAFKKNLKQSTFVWFLLIGIAVILFGDIYYLVYTSGIWKIIFMSMTMFFGFLYSTLLLFIFPYLSRFEDSIKTGIINSLLMGGFHFPSLFLLIIINYFPIIFIMSSFTGFMTAVYFFTFGGFSIFAFVNTIIIKRIFSKYDIKKGEK